MGGAVGTGGGRLADMQATLAIHLFPGLYEVRTRLTEAANKVAAQE